MTVKWLFASLLRFSPQREESPRNRQLNSYGQTHKTESKDKNYIHKPKHEKTKQIKPFVIDTMFSNMKEHVWERWSRQRSVLLARSCEASAPRLTGRIRSCYARPAQTTTPVFSSLRVNLVTQAVELYLFIAIAKGTKGFGSFQQRATCFHSVMLSDMDCRVAVHRKKERRKNN